MAEYQYNLADFGGFWQKLEATSTVVTTHFEVGEFPLEIEYDSSCSVYSHGYPSIYLDATKISEDAKPGDKITITFKIPSVKWPGAATSRRDVILNMRNRTRDKQIWCYYDCLHNSVKLVTSNTNQYLPTFSWTELLSDAVLTKDDSIGGFELSGTLVDDIYEIDLYPDWESDREIIAGTQHVTYSSFDDMKITITSEPAVAPTIDRKAMTLGWLMGRAVAAQRGQRANPRI